MTSQRGIFQAQTLHKLIALFILIQINFRSVFSQNQIHLNNSNDLNYDGDNNDCALSSQQVDNNICTLTGTMNLCLDSEILELISNTCGSATSLNLINFKITCADPSSTFNIRMPPDQTKLYNVISLKEVDITNCMEVYLATIKIVELNDFEVHYSNSKKAQPFKESLNKKFVNLSMVNTTHLLDSKELNTFKSNMNSTQFILKDNQTSEECSVNRKKTLSNGMDSTINISYTLLEPISSVIVQSVQISILNQIYSDSQLLLDAKIFTFASSSNIISSQFGIYRETTNPPQTIPIQIQNINISTFSVNCLSSLEEARKKMQYKSFFQINFTSNSSYIDMPQFDNRATLHKYLLDVLRNNYTMLVVTQTDTKLVNTTISTSKLGYFANNILIDTDSVISSDGLGCPADQGLGRGVIFGSNPDLYCAPSGAHHTSYGGIGLPSDIFSQNLSNNQTLQIIDQCYNNSLAAQFVSDSFPYDSLHITEGSGGGMNLDPNDLNSYNDLGGAGGGLVYFGAATKMVLNGVITCNGMKGSQIGNKLYGGGGSGGSVKIMATNFTGIGSIYAKGGDSSQDGTSGEGAGGIIDINIVNTEVVDSTLNYFIGLINTQKGQRNLDIKTYPFLQKFLAQNGSMITPFCPPGYQESPRGTCKPCSNNEYKDTPYGVCNQCPTNGQESFSAPDIAQGLYCQANCDKIICDPFGFYISIVGPYGIFFLQVTLSILTTGYVIRRIYRLKQGKIDHLPFDFEEATEQMRIDDQIITTDLSGSPDFILSDLLFHCHRIQVLGTNTLNNYWKLQRNPPPEVEYIINKEQYRKFADRFNHTVKWKMLDKIILISTSFIYYPLYWYLLTKVRKGVFKRARKFFEQNELKIINMNISGQFDKVQIKFTKSIDYTLCFFDIFDYKKSNFKYFFLNIPYFISLSGDGSFIKPLNINENDIFCKCLYFSINRNRKIEIVTERQRVMENLVNHKLRIDNSKKLNKFIQKFNRYTRSIDYMAPISLIQMSLAQTVELLNRWNLYFFNPNNVGCDLVVFEKPKKEGFKEIITVLENLDKDKFKEFVEKMVHTTRYLNNYYEINMKLFIYNLDSPIEVVAQTMDDQRITVATEGHILHQTVKESVLSQDFITIKEKLQRKEILRIRQSSVHSRFSFVEDIEQQSTKVEDTTMTRRTYKFIKRFTGFIRFCFFTHSPTTLSKHVLIFGLTTLIVLDTIMTMPTIFNAMYAFTQMNKEQILFQDLLFLIAPYPLAVWISPVLGLLLVTSQSYGIAKMYVIYNSMSLVDLFLNIIWTFRDNNPPSTLPFVYSLKVITLLFRVAILYLASKYLSTSIKLTHLNSQKRTMNL